MIPFLRGLFTTLLAIGSESGPTISAGTGSPNGAVDAPVSSIFLRTDGGANTAVYRKESGTGNTGWVAVSNAGGGGGSTVLTAGGQTQFSAANNTKNTAEVVFSVTGASVGQKAFASFSDDPADGAVDELEMDSYTLSAYVSATGNVTVRITSQTCAINPAILFPIQLMVV